MKLLIGIVTSGLPCNGGSLKTGSMGGSETALISVAKALKDRGHDVKVFCNCDKPGNYDGVDYFESKHISRIGYATKFDILIVSRFAQYLTIPVQAGLRVLWIHDIVPGEDALNQLVASMWQTDLIMPLSNFHRENYVSKNKDLDSWMWNTTNGIDTKLIESNIRHKIPGKLIYTSRPERGLPQCIDNIMPRIFKDNPNAKLSFAAYDISAMTVDQSVHDAAKYCAEVAKNHPSKFVNLGSLTKERLYQEISSAELLLYPTDFPEISCITAMEAQALGTPIVSSNSFALKETVGPDAGVLIDGSAYHDAAYHEKFSAEVTRLLHDNNARKAMGEAGKAWVTSQGYSWDAVAESWEVKFLDMMHTRFTENVPAVLTELERNRDLIPARNIAREVGDDISTVLYQEQIDVAKTIDAPPPTTPKEFQDRYNRVLTLMQENSIRPETILDWGCGEEAFGFLLKHLVPKADVTLVDRDEEVVSKLKALADKRKMELDILCTDKYSDLSKKYDFIFLGEYLQTLENPAEHLRTLQDHLTDTGHILMTTQYGTDAKSLKAVNKKVSKLWDFSFSDLTHMFQDAKGFVATFFDMGGQQAIAPLGYWIYYFNKSEKSTISEPSLTKRKLVTQPYTSVACCMIVKDEEDNLRKCLKSVVPYVDRVVITDTGSTDKTLEIAEEFGCDIRQMEFEDFSRARNASIADISEDWIYWVDADEVTVNGELFRKYLRTSIFEGLVIRQHHLMLDVQGTFDNPIRLFRNKPHYKFVGNIHEHCEDTSFGKFDQAIQPALVVPDINIAHYGYLNEAVRRDKCSNRNMRLLKKDLEENPKRELTWVLAIRDFINMTKWELAKRKSPMIAADSPYRKMLEGAISLFYERFSDPAHIYHKLAEPLCQEALKFLANAGLPYKKCPIPPFQVACTLSAGGGALNTKEFKPQFKWFASAEHLRTWLLNLNATLITQAGLDDPKKYDDDRKPIVLTGDEYKVSPQELLSFGENIMPTGTY